MGREIKFRLYWKGKFYYWGFFNLGEGIVFSGPVGGVTIREALELSEQYIGKRDRNGKPHEEADVCKYVDVDFDIETGVDK